MSGAKNFLPGRQVFCLPGGENVMNLEHRTIFLKSERLYLRPIEEGDLPTAQRHVVDPEIRDFINQSFPVNARQEREWWESIGSNRTPSVITLAIVLKENDRYIGSIDLHNIDWLHRCAETGTLIGEKECRGQGYGSEAKHLLLEYAFRTLGLHRIESHVYANNERSLKCQLKCGYVEEARLRKRRWKNGEWVDEVILAILAEDGFATHG